MTPSQQTEPALPTPDSPLEALMMEALDAYERGDLLALEALYAAHPGEQTKLERALERLRSVGLLEEHSEVLPLPARLGEFELLEKIGSGGMGVVYRARQGSLGREVALKVLRPELLFFPGNRRRFRREIEAVARLAHPGIVPIYSVGEEGSLPYFAMELVTGATLADLLSDLAGRPRAALLGRDLWLALGSHVARGSASRQPASRSPAGAGPAAATDSQDNSRLFEGSYTQTIGRILLEVARALQHAHDRGVLHRDIKPSNIMLTSSGRVLLLDFGLANAPGADRLTRTGSQIGSLPYMSPEQARGQHEQVGVRSDVYSLGVSFYEALTGISPYLDPGSSERTRLRVLEGRPREPRALVPSLPRDLQVVCLKAFDLEPARRYASVADFAADLQAALEGRPITARRLSPVARLGRWVRQEPATATALGLTLILVIGLPSGWAILTNQKSQELKRLNGQLNAALEQTDQQRVVAERSFVAALDSIDRMLNRVGKTVLADTPRFERVRAELLQDALALNLQLSELRPQDPRLLEAVTETRIDLADVLLRIGSYAAATEQVQVVADSLRSLPGAPTWALLLLVQALVIGAEAERLLGHSQVCLALTREASGALQQVRGRPTETAGQQLAIERAQARYLGSLAAYERWAGVREQSEEMLSNAIAVQRRLLQADPKDGDTRFSLAKSLDTLSLWHYESDQLQAAIEVSAESVALWEACYAREPDSPIIQLQLFSTLGNLGDMLGEAGKIEESRPHLERAIALGRELAAEYPDTPRFRQNLAVALVQWSNWYLAQNLLEPGKEVLKEALELQRAQVRETPDSAEHVTTLVMTGGNLGQILLHQGDSEGARTLLNEARELLIGALQQAPQDRQLKGWLERIEALLARIPEQGADGDSAIEEPGGF